MKLFLKFYLDFIGGFLLKCCFKMFASLSKAVSFI